MGIMEAMLQSVCPVVTNVGGSPELIRHEIDGVVVPPEDPLAIAQGIRQLYSDLPRRERLARSAYQRARDEFSIARWTDRLYTAYAEMLVEPERVQAQAA